MNIGVIIIIILGLSVGLVALLALCDVVFPAVVGRARRNAEIMPLRSFAVGLINFAFFGLLSAALLSGDEGAKAIGLLVATILLGFVTLGLAAMARLVGERLRPHDSRLRQILIGAIVLDMAAFTPLVGWFLVPALAGLVGYGATIIALVRRGADTRPGSTHGQDVATAPLE